MPWGTKGCHIANHIDPVQRGTGACGFAYTDEKGFGGSLQIPNT